MARRLVICRTIALSYYVLYSSGVLRAPSPRLAQEDPQNEEIVFYTVLGALTVRNTVTRSGGACAAGLYAVIAPQMGKQVVAFQAAMAIMGERFPGAFKGYTLKVTESHQSSKRRMAYDAAHATHAMYATHATHATYATRATYATYATRATYNTYATRATYATYATPHVLHMPRTPHITRMLRTQRTPRMPRTPRPPRAPRRRRCRSPPPTPPRSQRQRQHQPPTTLKPARIPPRP
eukprot:1195788-Prorocentrum_minimum.AAC.9